MLSGWFWLTLVASFLSSVSLAFVNVVISTYLVARIDEAMIGRVNGTIAPLFVGAMLLGSASSGVLMNATSLFAVYVISVLVLLVSILPGRRVQFASSKAGSAAANLAVPGQAVE
ncbi:hypothetical protein ABEX25_07680 [Paenibacillus thiaminolyticus]|uniref:hypothetical protein n=1 Tax=Paenibacillus thiaminolyticus TaxID=49283 RepID=UPI003D2B8B6A